MLVRKIHQHLAHHLGYRAIQVINGVGRTIAAIAVAEIGDVHRFSSPEALCCWTGLTPKQRESDTKGHREGISKQGSRLLRWALVEGTARYHGGPTFAADYRRTEGHGSTSDPAALVARARVHENDAVFKQGQTQQPFDTARSFRDG